jgi:hypothetical protein
MAAFVAFDWLIMGEKAARSASAFGATFAAGLFGLFLAAVPSQRYSLMACDALSTASLLAGVTGAAGLALAAHFAGARHVAVRTVLLVGLAGLVLALMQRFAPSCLGNPLDMLPLELHTLWLDRVDEARPTLAYLPAQPAEAAFRLGPLVCGLIAALSLLALNVERRANALFAALILASLALALYQTRFYVFGHVFVVLPLALAAARLRALPETQTLARTSAILVAASALPMLWGSVGVALSPPANAAAASAQLLCSPQDAVAALRPLPAGRVLAPASYGPSLLLETDHSVLHAHYHRNVEGISAAINAFTTAPEEAVPRIRAARVDYVLACAGDPELSFLALHAPGGLADRLAGALASAAPAPGLEAVGQAGAITVYRVR